jgi:hypothetical protein
MDLIDRRELIKELIARLDQWKGLPKEGVPCTASIAAQELEDVIEIVLSQKPVD